MSTSLPISFLAAGSDLGVSIDGARRGPRALLADFPFVATASCTYFDMPTIIKSRDVSDRAKNLSSVLAYNQQLYQQCLKQIRHQHFPVCLGGDHSISIASGLASLQQHRSLGLIWFDAHTDFHRLDTTITGNLHGLPLAVLVGHEPTLNNLCPDLYYDPAHTVIVGARSVDAPEWQNLRAAGVSVLTMAQINQRGISAVLNSAFDQALDGTDGLHFSFDLDVLDPGIAPGVSVPAAHGLNQTQLQIALDVIGRRWAMVRSFDLVEYNPKLDHRQQTLTLARHILQSLLTD